MLPITNLKWRLSSPVRSEQHIRIEHRDTVPQYVGHSHPSMSDRAPSHYGLSD